MSRNLFAYCIFASTLITSVDVFAQSVIDIPSTPAAGVPAPVMSPPPDVTPIPPGGPNAPTPTATDTSTKTCNPTMSMLQAVNCANYPAQLQSFCAQNKPHLMSGQDCSNAEQYALKANPNGSHKQECMNQTFVNGSSSWSFVLACANTKSSQGSTGDPSQAVNKVGIDTTPTGSIGGGSPGDPQCLASLQASGDKFQGFGQYKYGGEIGQCVVATAVRYSFKNLRYSAVMDCNLAKLMDKWEPLLQGIGVTGLVSLGTLNCRNMNNAEGHLVGHTSAHSAGYAADFSAFTIGGQNYSVSHVRTDPATMAALQKVVNTMCEAFDLTLAMQWYGPGQPDVHGQFSQHGCDPHGHY